MTVQVTVLGNGLRIATSRMDHLETVSLGLWVGAGARQERDGQHGLSHFLEHMAFKGTAKRSARAIAEEIEQVGGELNAATGLETTGYFARVLKGDDGIALELLADILLNSTFTDADIAREREVICQEIAAAQDSPDDIGFDLLQDTAFPGQAVGRPILGTAASVGAFTAADFRSFLNEHYVPGNMVISAAGAVEHGAVVRHVEALFGGLTPKAAQPVTAARYAGGASASGKPFEQSHVLIGLPSPSYFDPDYYAAQVFSGLFGGGMSSRLFQEIRENRGLCYSIYSSVWGLSDTGMLAVHAATGSDMVDELSAVVAAELRALAESGPNAAELQRSKSQLKAGLLMALESCSVRAEQMARHLLIHERLVPVPELVDRVTAVTAQDIQTLAAGFAGSAPTVAVVGSGKASKAQAQRTAARFVPGGTASASPSRKAKVKTKA